MIEDAEKAISATVAISDNDESICVAEEDKNVCQETGLDKTECDHC